MTQGIRQRLHLAIDLIHRNHLKSSYMCIILSVFTSTVATRVIPSLDSNENTENRRSMRCATQHTLLVLLEIKKREERRKTPDLSSVRWAITACRGHPTWLESATDLMQRGIVWNESWCWARGPALKESWIPSQRSIGRTVVQQDRLEVHISTRYVEAGWLVFPPPDWAHFAHCGIGRWVS